MEYLNVMNVTIKFNSRVYISLDFPQLGRTRSQLLWKKWQCWFVCKQVGLLTWWPLKVFIVTTPWVNCVRALPFCCKGFTLTNPHVDSPLTIRSNFCLQLHSVEWSLCGIHATTSHKKDRLRMALTDFVQASALCSLIRCIQSVKQQSKFLC